MVLKPQDAVFLVILIILLWKRDPRLFAIGGVACLIISIPLFSQYIFFTAQRLVTYAFLLFSISLLLNLFNFVKK